MKACMTVFLTLAFSAFVLAQPVITRSDLMFPGDDFFAAAVPVLPDAGPAGAGVTWDFSGVMVDPNVSTYQTVDAASTPFAGSFPEANIAFLSSQGFSPFIQYEFLDDNIWEEHGFIVPMNSTLTYTDPRTFLEFPVMYGNQWQDDFSYTSVASLSLLEVMGEGTVSAMVDGYGTLLLPQTIFDDALRVKIIGESVDTADLGGGIGEQNFYYDTTFVWFSPSYRGSLCSHTMGRRVQVVSVLYPDTIITEEQTTTFKSFSLDPMAMGTSAVGGDVSPGKYAMRISPNPFSREVTLEFVSGKTQQMDFEILDLNGKLWLHKQIAAEPGENAETLNVPESPGGMYVALLRSEEGVDVQTLVRIPEFR